MLFVRNSYLGLKLPDMDSLKNINFIICVRELALLVIILWKKSGFHSHHFNVVSACDRQTDRQTMASPHHCHGRHSFVV